MPVTEGGKQSDELCFAAHHRVAGLRVYRSADKPRKCRRHICCCGRASDVCIMRLLTALSGDRATCVSRQARQADVTLRAIPARAFVTVLGLMRSS